MFDPWVGKIPWRRKWQYSCLENPIDGGAWGATVHGVAESDTFELLSTQARTHRDLVEEESHSICPSVTGLFHLA